MLTTVHGLATEDYPRAARVLTRCSRTVVAVSEDVGESLLAGGVPPDRLTVIENAVPEPVPCDRGAVREELGLPVGVPVALCVARLAPPKRVDLLLEAWRGVPGALLLVVGDGPERSRLERSAGERVRFLGEREDVARLLGAADLLVLPSDREGLPMSVLESMAAGVPVVASAVGGLRDIEPGAITLTAPRAAEPLATSVRTLLADPDLRRRQAEQARDLVARRYSSHRMGQAYESAYRELAKGRDEP